MSNKPRFVGEKATLEGRIEYVRGVTYKAASDLHQELDESSYVLFRANNIQDGKLTFDDVQFVDRSKVKQKQLLRKGDILVCASSGSKGLVGKAALVSEDVTATFGAFCCVLRANGCDPRYLAHYFQSSQYRSAIETLCTGSNINNLKAGNFNSLFVPRYQEQDELLIVERLDEIQAQISLAKAQLSKLDQLVKSRFVEMFGDPISNSKQLDTKPGSALFKIGNGKSKPASERYEVGIPAYGGNGISWYSKECLVDDPTIVIGRVGRHCGNTRLVNEPCWVTDNAMYIKRFLDDGLDLIYLDELMRLIGFNRYADKGDLWKITQQPFMDFAYPMPPLEDQRRFSSFVAQVDKPRFIAQQQIEKLQMLYDSLAQDYFGV